MDSDYYYYNYEMNRNLINNTKNLGENKNEKTII